MWSQCLDRLLCLLLLWLTQGLHLVRWPCIVHPPQGNMLGHLLVRSRSIFIFMSIDTLEETSPWMNFCLALYWSMKLSNQYRLYFYIHTRSLEAFSNLNLFRIQSPPSKEKKDLQKDMAAVLFLYLLLLDILSKEQLNVLCISNQHAGFEGYPCSLLSFFRFFI